MRAGGVGWEKVGCGSAGEGGEHTKGSCWFDGTGGAGRTKEEGESRMDAVAGLRTRSEVFWKSWNGI